MDRKQIEFKIAREVDFINSPTLENSLEEFLKKYPNGASDAVICKALLMSQDELDKVTKSAIMKLKAKMGTNNE